MKCVVFILHSRVPLILPESGYRHCKENWAGPKGNPRLSAGCKLKVHGGIVEVDLAYYFWIIQIIGCHENEEGNMQTSVNLPWSIEAYLAMAKCGFQQMQSEQLQWVYVAKLHGVICPLNIPHCSFHTIQYIQ